MFGITIKNTGGDGEVNKSTPSPSPSTSSSSVKRKRPGPASKTLKRRKPETNGHGEEDLPRKVSGASPQEASPLPSSVQKEEKCFLCFKSVNHENGWENSKDVLKNFRDVMMIKGEDDFPKCSFCGDCEEGLDGLLKVEKIIQEAEFKKAEIVSGIAKKVLDSTEEKAGLTTEAVVDGNPWMKWRKAIVEGCRRKLLDGDNSLAQQNESKLDESESDVTFHSVPSAPTSPWDQTDLLSKAEENVDKEEPKKPSGEETMDGLQSGENLDEKSAVLKILQEEGELKVDLESMSAPSATDLESMSSPSATDLESVSAPSATDLESMSAPSATDLENGAGSPEQMEVNVSCLDMEVTTILSSPEIENVGDKNEIQEKVSQSIVEAEVQQEEKVEQLTERISSVQIQIKKEMPEEGCSEQVDNEDKFSLLAISSVKSVGGGSTGSGGVKQTTETPSLSVTRKVNVARKRTGGYYPIKISGKLFQGESGCDGASQNSSLVIDDGALPSKASVFPNRLPENPRFMLSREKMTPAVIQSAKTIIRQLSGSISSSNEFDPDCVGIIAERLGSSEQVLCSIASGMFLLKKGYLEDCREAGRFVSIKKKHLWKEDDAKQNDKEERKLAKASYNWMLAQRREGKKGVMFGKKFFLLPTTHQRMEVSRRMIRAAGGELVEDREEATIIIKDGPPPKKNKGIPIKNSSNLYTMIVSDPPK